MLGTVVSGRCLSLAPLCHADGAHGRGDRRWRLLVLPILLRRIEGQWKIDARCSAGRGRWRPL